MKVEVSSFKWKGREFDVSPSLILEITKMPNQYHQYEYCIDGKDNEFGLTLGADRLDDLHTDIVCHLYGLWKEYNFVQEKNMTAAESNMYSKVKDRIVLKNII